MCSTFSLQTVQYAFSNMNRRDRAHRPVLSVKAARAHSNLETSSDLCGRTVAHCSSLFVSLAKLAGILGNWLKGSACHEVLRRPLWVARLLRRSSTGIAKAIGLQGKETEISGMM